MDNIVCPGVGWGGWGDGGGGGVRCLFFVLFWYLYFVNLINLYFLRGKGGMTPDLHHIPTPSIDP